MKFFFSVFAGLRVWFCERGWRCVVSVCGCYVCLSRGIFGRLRVRFFCWAQARSTCIQAYGMVCLHCKCTCSLDPRDVHITSVLFSYSRTKCFNHSARTSPKSSQFPLYKSSPSSPPSHPDSTILLTTSNPFLTLSSNPCTSPLGPHIENMTPSPPGSK